jgi:AraC-like DNA-binding protein
MAQWRNQDLFKIEQLKIAGNSENEENAAEITPPKAAIIDSSVENENRTIDATLNDYSGALDPSIRSSLLEAVRQHMQEHQTYLDNQLTLTRLAGSVGISTHHLSEVLNQHEGKNFYQFVNEYRINYICERLKEDKEIKILDLAMNAGFSSKSTFNAVFKQFIQQTPSQYRQKLAR